MPTARRLTVTAALAALLPATGAAGQTPAPTVAVDRPCYTAGDPIAVSGTGYTPGGDVSLMYGANGRLATDLLTAGPDGALAGTVGAPDPEYVLSPDHARAELFLTANDQARIEAGTQPPESQFAFTTFTLSRWDVLLRSAGGRLLPGRRVRVRAVGFTHAVDRTLYAHWRLGDRRLRSVRLGRLAGPCGDLTARLRDAFPMRSVLPGTYRIGFNASRTDPLAEPRIEFTARIGRRDARP